MAETQTSVTLTANGREIGRWLRDPEKPSEHPVAHSYFCRLEQRVPGATCSMLKEDGACVHYRMLGRGCQYGNHVTNTGPTKRSKSYRDWVNEKRAWNAEGPKMPKLGFVSGCYHEIGEYAYLPYPHMNMNTAVPFLEHSAFFVSGSDFMLLKDFTPEVVVKIAKFRPIALMGGEITDYQKKSVPVFLWHLRARNPNLYAEAAKLDPSIEQKVLKLENLPHVVARLSDIPVGRTEGYTVDKTIIVKKWDGKELTIECGFTAIGTFFSPLKPKEKNSLVTMTLDVNVEETSVMVTDKAIMQDIGEKRPSVIQLINK